jgi:hypothetical protein
LTSSIGLVIQGPIFSPGYGPYEFDQSGNFIKSWIEFDATTSIIDTVREASKKFDYIVISTWQSEYANRILTELASNTKVVVVLNSENTFLVDKRKTGTHKYHQIYSLLQGAQVLVDLRCDVLVKLRTDHGVDVSQLYESAIRHPTKNSMSLGVPNVNLFELDRLTDFYFVGRPEVIHRVCENYLANVEFCADTHRDYFLSFLNYLSGNGKLVERIQQADSNLIRDYFCILAWTKYFYPLPSAMFREFYWRGRKINHHLNAWVRWFYVFHSTGKRFSPVRFTLNLIFIISIRQLKKPTIRLSSGLLFRWYRWKAFKAFP